MNVIKRFIYGSEIKEDIYQKIEEYNDDIYKAKNILWFEQNTLLGHEDSRFLLGNVFYNGVFCSGLCKSKGMV